MIERIAFLLARIAEDEAAARKAAHQDSSPSMRHPDGSRQQPVSRDDSSEPGGRDAEPGVRWAARRVFLECVAKRRLIAEIADHGRLSYDYKRLMLETLAEPYREHPDFRDEWGRSA